MAGKEDFDAARERITATGAFASVAYHYEPAPGGEKHPLGTSRRHRSRADTAIQVSRPTSHGCRLRPLVAHGNTLLDNLILATDVAIERAVKPSRHTSPSAASRTK